MPESKPKKETEPRRSADSGERAYTAIHKLLVEYKVKPEERINEVQLARTLGVSRTPIREALNRLASEGFVTLTPNKGFFFRALSIDDLLDLYEFRMVIECAAFTFMCQRADDAELGRLDAYWRDAVKRYADRDADEMLTLDEGFHLLIAELSGNAEIRQHLVAINARIRFIRRVQIQHVSHDETLIDSHSRIVEAAMARDVAKGTERLRMHIEMTVSATQRALKDALLQVYMADSDMKRAPRSARTVALQAEG